MSIVKSSSSNLTLNADGSGNDISMQSNAAEKLKLTAEGNLHLQGSDSRIQLNAQGGANVVGNNTVHIRGDGAHMKLMAASGGNYIFEVNGTEELRVQSGGGISFNGDTAAENALDDYEEGTHTPTIVCSTSGSYTLDTGANVFAYTKIGRVVHIQGGISAASESSPNGNLRMSLPFTPFTGTKDTDYSLGNCAIDAHGGTIDNAVHIFVFGANYAQFATVADNGSFIYIDHDDVDTAFAIKFSFTYIAA
ncbi:hypothetical protein OAD60_04540 [Candidatus Thioglobus sp.]|nr:hypothetical protein [Candidatus Thioglobus sp.]